MKRIVLILLLFIGCSDCDNPVQSDPEPEIYYKNCMNCHKPTNTGWGLPDREDKE